MSHQNQLILVVIYIFISKIGMAAEIVAPPPSIEPNQYEHRQSNLKISKLPIQKLSLNEAIALALSHNRTIKTAYLQRITDKWSLYVARDEFRPHLDLDISTTAADTIDKSTGTRTRTYTTSYSPTASLALRTGGSLSATWNNSYTRSKDDDAGVGTPSHTSGISLSFSQPLLKGGGLEVAQASQVQAERAEQVNLLSLKSSLISTITSVIQAYRSLVQTKRAYEISKDSLERTRKLLEVNKLLIDAGRMAAVESIQAEADLARGELDLRTSENSLDAARLALLRILDIDKYSRIDIIEDLDINEVDLNFDKLQTIAFAERTDYLQAKLGLLDSQLNLILAKNNKLWELGLTASYSNTLTNRSRHEVSRNLGEISEADYSLGMSLKIPFGDYTLEQTVVNARIALKNQQLALIELKDEILIGLEDQIRDINIKFEQVRLAKRSRELAEQTLFIENEKLRAGRSSNFELVSFQNSLVTAENSEVDAIIAYHNALTSLDEFLGTTLDTWGIEIQNITRKSDINKISDIPEIEEINFDQKK